MCLSSVQSARWLVISCLVGGLSGCAPPTATKSTNVTTSSSSVAESETSTDGAVSVDTSDAGTVESVESTPAQPAGDGNPESLFVMLTTKSLTAGIPGEGPLAVDEIRGWLDQPEVHITLNVILPLGLDKGADQISIPEDNPLTMAKIELGRQLYFDTRMSGDGTISCASCHHPDHGFTKPDRFGVGIGGKTGNRNSPVSYNRLLSSAQFWDGRAATLEDQAVGPIANEIEHGTTHEKAVAAIEAVEGYRIQFDRIFGPDSVNIDNIGRAIASFERVIVTGPTPFDYYEQLKPMLDYDEEDLEEMKADDPKEYARYVAAVAAADANPMSEAAKRGQELFFGDKTGCTACHVGANFTDEKFHNLGVGMDQDEPDLGRYKETKEEKDRGAFKTPTIRNVELSAPYMHDGSQDTLEEVVEWYVKGGHPNPHLSDKIKKLKLSDQDKKDLVEFMKSVTGKFPDIETGRIPE